MRQIKYFSTFTGIGGFELGIGRQHECVGYSEIDRYADEIYKKHFPNHKNYGDITKINTKELPDFDLLVGGFPCQSFSIAGKRKGFGDTRGTLFFEIARIIKSKRPRLLLLENVKGLLSHDDGATFATIIRTLDELGYDLQWQVLNSKNHGVPQNRERVFIVGHLRGTPRPEVFPIRYDGAKTDELPRHIANTLTRRYEGAQAVGTYIGESELNAQEIKQINNPKHSNDRVYDPKGIGPTINTMQGGNRQPFILQKSQDWREKGTLRKFEKHSPTLRANMGDNQPMIIQRPRGNNKGGNKKIAPTLTGTSYQDNNHVSTLQGARIRRLTPTECERLQAYPDGWTEGVSDTQRYKVLGNGVTVNVVRDIVREMLK